MVKVEILGRGYIYKVRGEILYGDLELAIVELDIRQRYGVVILEL